MQTSRIVELLTPYFDGASPLSGVQLEQISTYIDLLIRWNSRVNLTAIRRPEEIVTRHLGESLFAARHLFPQAVGDDVSPPTGAKSNAVPGDAGAAESPVPGRPAGWGLARVVDVGSGAGFPGLPIKIWSPGATVTLIESNHKKVAFLRETIRALTLIDIDVTAARAEDFPAHSAGTVTLRAVERFIRILPIATRLLARGGRLALLIGERQLSEAAGLCPDLAWSPPMAIPGSKASVLAIACSQT